MKVKIRFLALLVAGNIGIATLWFALRWNFTQNGPQTIEEEKLVSALLKDDEYGYQFTETQGQKPQILNSKCQMETCFNFSMCRNGFKIYVYPFENDARISVNYGKIIHVIKKSVYYTKDPKEACVFVSSHDTTDQDKLSRLDYVTSLENKISNLPYWNGGRNHIIFNLYSGTWPDYKDTLDFDVGKAILVKASFNALHYRPYFDISFPLFDKDQPIFSEGNLPHSNEMFPVLKQYKLVFKGKRYLNGIGGESRASLHHIHNNEDIIMLTTCKHGLNWKDMKDDRCDHDNELYDR